MSDKKQKAGVKVPGRVEWPNLTERDLDVPEGQAVTMLDYEASSVVTYGVADKRAKPSRGAS